MNKPAAIYARVSSDRQKENHTIASQTAALLDHAATNGYSVPPEWVFQDEGYSGAILARPTHPSDGFAKQWLGRFDYINCLRMGGTAEGVLPLDENQFHVFRFCLWKTRRLRTGTFRSG